MSDTIENRVVNMKFNNAAFEQAASKTLGTLGTLKEKLNFTGAAKGLQNISLESSKVDFANMAKGIDNITHKFSLMNIAGVTVFANLVNKAANAGLSVLKSFTIDPIHDGFEQYQQQVNAAQTILGNVAQSGATLKDVTKTLDTMNVYANKTIYNFSDMATNLGTFTSAGVKLGPAADAIQGLSNVAAAAGAGTQQAAGAMYQLSQALGRGKLQAQDWNSVVAAGMASSNFKTSILETAKAIGTLKIPKTETVAQWQKAGGSFQDAMSKGLITSDVLVQTLQVMTGNLTDAQLAAKGYTKEQIKSLQAIAKQASSAAENVKTFHALIDNLTQGVGSAYASVFKAIIGDLPNATKEFTYFSKILNAAFVDPVQHFADKLAVVFNQFRHYKGNIRFLEAIGFLFKALASYISPIKDAFGQVFPVASGRKLASLAIKFKHFTESLVASKDQMANIKKVFVAVFTVVKIILGSIGFAIKSVFNLLHIIGQLAPGALALLGSLGDRFSQLLNYLVHPGPFGKFFHSLDATRTAVLIPVAHFVSQLAEAFATLIDGDYSGFRSKIKDAFGTIGDIITAVHDVIVSKIGGVLDVLSNVGDFFTHIGSVAVGSSSGLIQTLGGIAASIGEFLGNLSSNAGQKIVQVIDGISSSLQNLFSKVNFHAGFGDISASADAGVQGLSKLEVVGNAVKKMWDGIAAAFQKVYDIVAPVVSIIGSVFKTILDKAAGYVKGLSFHEFIALLNTGFLILIYREFKKFLKSARGITDGLNNLFASASGTLDQVTSSLKTMQKDVRSKIILRLAIAIGVLAASVYVLANIDPKKLGIAMGAITTLFIELIAALAVIEKKQLISKKGFATTASLVLLAGAILLLAIAVKLFSTISWEDTKNGLYAVAAVLGGLALYTRLAALQKGGFSSAAGMLVLAFALVALAGAIIIYNRIPVNTLVKGILAITATLVFVGLALRAFPQNNIVKISVSLVIISGAMIILAQALKILSKISKGSLFKAVTTLAVTLGILLVAVLLLANPEVDAGVTALLLVSGALIIVAKALSILGAISVGNILKALGVIVVLIGIIALLTAAVIAFPPIIAALIGLAAGLVLLGAAMLLAGAGFALFAGGIAVLATLGGAAVAALSGLLQLLPLLATQGGLAVIAFATVIGDGASEIVGAFMKVFDAFVTAFAKETPRVIDAVGNFIIKMATKVSEVSGKVAEAALALVEAFLTAIDSHMGKIITKGTDIVLKLIEGFGNNAKPIVDAVFTAILQFINALTAAIDYYAPQLRTAGGKLAESIIDGLTGGLTSGKTAHGILGAVTSVVGGGVIGGAKKLLDSNSPSKVFIKIGEDVMTGMAIGIANNAGDAANSTEKAGNGVIDKMKSTLVALNDHINSNLDLQPTIAPVIDLTEVKRGAAQLSGLMAGASVAPNMSLVAANALAAQQAANQQATTDTNNQPTKQIVFEQTNVSREALTPVEVYRRTHNLLSQAKTMLGVPEMIPA